VGRPVCLGTRPRLLAGREKLLAKLDVKLTDAGGPGLRTVALWGVAGAGKTSAAMEYAHRHMAEVGLAWQFVALDPAVLTAGFGELAARLGARDAVETRNPVAAVHEALASFRTGWLLIFDDVPDQASVQAFLPSAGDGRVLITSQDRHWPRGQALEVPVLGATVAADLLVNRTGDQTRQAAGELAEELGGLPLALALATAYLRATGDSLAGYLTSFRQRQSAVLGRGEPADYGGTVATTWALAFGQLEKSAPVAAGLLRLLAFCAPEAVPLRLLLRPRPELTEGLPRQVAAALRPLLEDPRAAKGAIAALRRYSLISPAARGAVSVHRLVQAATADQMPAELAQAWRRAAAAVIETAIPADPRQPDTWPVFAALLAHAQVALTADSGGMGRIASYLGHSGNHAAARELYRGVVEARVRLLGPEHPHALAARANLAYWAGEAGNAAGARDQLAALLPVIERVSGPAHPGTLTARANLAYWAGEAGNAAGARDQYAALLRIRKQVSGPEHPRTLAARDSLARWTGEAGDAAAARGQYAALVPVMEQVLGPEHPDTLTARGNLASFTGEAGDAVGARDRYAAVVPAMERVLGPEHPDTLTAHGNLARWTGEAGDAAGARDRYAAVATEMERVLGPEHPDTLTAHGNLASFTGEAGDAAGAQDRYAAVVPAMERVLGPEHPDTLTARGNLAQWTGQAGDAAGARDQYAALVPIRKQVSGPEHPDTLAARGNLARWTGEAGDPAEARHQYAALLPIYERASGPDHPETQAVQNNLVYWTREAGGGPEAGVG